MKIKLTGASGGEVTGSAYLIRTKKATILVDAGMFQGGRQSEAKNRLPQGAQPEDIELLKWFSTLAPAKPKVILTHGEDLARGTLAKPAVQAQSRAAAAGRSLGVLV